ncbi:MAG TPA: EamA family transporter [Gaiellaceae bacterium]
MFAVALVSQAAGFAVLGIAVAVRGDLGLRSFVLGLVGGVGGAVGLTSFYEAMAVGTMSVVSPIAACSALVPFAISLATGERPAGIAVAGAFAALAGAVVASLEERRSESPERARAVALAGLSALAIGLFVYFLGLGSREGDALSTLAGARVGSLSALVAIVLVTRTRPWVPATSLAAVAAVGLADVTANVLFAFASGHGLLALVSVLGSLYPVVTLVLAHVLLGERISPVQRAGVALALAGVVAIAAA